MSGDNSILPSSVGVPRGDDRAAFDIPTELATRYQVRIVETPGSGERRLGMFLTGDRTTPSLEIANDRIVARNEDPETIASLVKLAEHNRWKTIDVEGSPEFRKAVWTAGARAGMTVNGYEPEFAEAEHVEALRKADLDRRQREAADRPDPDANGPSAERSPSRDDAVADIVSTAEAGHTASGRMAEDLARQTSELAAASDERIVLSQAFERGIRALEASGDPRAQAAREAASALVDQIYGEREERTGDASGRAAQPQPEPEPRIAERDHQREEKADRQRESELLAELFLHGASETIAADPRLANARQAQAAMERHIAEVFQADATPRVAATLESRQMISDVLRRGLDVSVREPAPVRQIEPIQSPEIER